MIILHQLILGKIRALREMNAKTPLLLMPLQNKASIFKYLFSADF